MRKLFTQISVFMLIMLSVAFTNLTFAQGNDIVYDLSDDGLYEDLLLKSAPTTNYDVKVAILYYQDDSGNGPTKSSTNDNYVMNALSAIYTQHELTFTKVKSVIVELSDADYDTTRSTGYIDQATGERLNIEDGLNIIIADNPWHPTAVVMLQDGHQLIHLNV